jgi:hypothetical protein
MAVEVGVLGKELMNISLAHQQSQPYHHANTAV